MTSILIYIIVFLVAAVVILSVEVSVQCNKNKEYLGRRDKKDKLKQQAEDNLCSRKCELYCSLETTVIPELKDELERWQLAYEVAMKMYASVKTDNEILQSIIAKLRIGKPKQQTEPAIKHNGICLTCHFKNNCTVTEGDIFRDDTGQVADCELYMKAIIPKEEHNDTKMQKM